MGGNSTASKPVFRSLRHDICAEHILANPPALSHELHFLSPCNVPDDFGYSLIKTLNKYPPTDFREKATAVTTATWLYWYDFTTLKLKLGNTVKLRPRFDINSFICSGRDTFSEQISSSWLYLDKRPPYFINSTLTRYTSTPLFTSQRHYLPHRKTWFEILQST